MFHLKRYYILFIAFFACILLSAHAFAQPQARGFGNVAPAAASTSGGRTVALVVGVSDYPYVAPLNYAAEDALLVYDFLQSSAGGNVSPANMRLLINEEATAQNIVIRGLSWIENSVKPVQGDRIIIYLAGHGDAISSDEAFFLCYNANPAGDKNNYIVSGTLSIETLKKRISKISATGAEVVLIMDACRSGDLPGVRTGITNPFESVVERKAGETLMLSASANQLAVEDRRWGRGHGVFTWNLIQGLSGKADENGDGSVDFYEIEQYTKSKVRKETQAMGRMQVPQFAASPSGGGVLGRTDNVFLNKLSTEALSAVSVSESIAQARTAAESSWFTDSTLYVGFNDLKKQVRKGNYLGEGSAESIYGGLTAQFSSTEIEPIRLYYMSALASAGFEAISKDLLCTIGVMADDTYYKRRLSYLRKASELQLKQGEVYQLEDYLKIVEAITQVYGGKTALSQGLVDSLSSMQVRFGRSAAYYYWIMALNIDHIVSKQVTNQKLIAPLKLGLLDSCLKLAPDWPRINLFKMFTMPGDDYDEELGRKINNLIASDSLNDEFLFLATLFYSKHKPYDLTRRQNAIFRRGELSANPQAVVELMAQIFSLEGIEIGLVLSEIFNSEACRNYYHFDLSMDAFSSLIKAVNKSLTSPIDEELYNPNYSIILRGLIKYGAFKNKLAEITDVLLQLLEHSKGRAYTEDLAIISSLIDNKIGYEQQSKMVDSLLYFDLRTDPTYFANSSFSDSVTRFMNFRLFCITNIEELKSYRKEEMKRLSLFSYSGFKDEFMIFRAENYIADVDNQVQESFADSLLELCHRLPSKKNYRLYWDLIQMRKWTIRQTNLFMDSLFLQACDTLLNSKPEKVFLRRMEARYYCSKNDTINLQILVRGMQNDGQADSIAQLVKSLDLNWQNWICDNMLKSDTIEMSFRDLVDLGLLDRAQFFFESHGAEWKLKGGAIDYMSVESVMNTLAAIKLFNLKGDFLRSSLIMEELLNRTGDLMLLPIPLTRQKFRRLLGPYDAFIQSKEYKAMMARVYAAPEK